MGSIRTTPITGPKAWRGAELASDPTWIVAWSAAELAEIDHALGVARASGRPLADVDRAHFPLAALASRLSQVLDEISIGRGFVLLRGLPVDRYADDEVGLILWGLAAISARRCTRTLRATSSGTSTITAARTATSTCAATRPTPTCPTTPTPATWWGCCACAAGSPAA
jgi:hypothetical protein